MSSTCIRRQICLILSSCLEGKKAIMKCGAVLGFLTLFAFCTACNGAIPRETLKKISKANGQGPYLGLVVPNSFEMNPLLRSNGFVPNKKLGALDFAGRRFRFGRIEKKKVIMVMTGLGMLNAGTTTQLLLGLFEVEGVLHFGIAGNADPNLQIGDVTIPRHWAHLGLWYWQRYGDDETNELSLESNGDYTREIGYLKFSDYDREMMMTGEEEDANLLNRVWYQPEEIFPVTGTPEERQHAFWVPADSKYLEISKGLQGMELERCVNATTCLSRSPMVTVVERGCSADTFVDNAAYRGFLRSKFNVTPIDMETASVALVCLQQSTPFVAIRSLSDLAGGGSDLSNQASVYASLAAQNAATTLVKFVSLLV